MTGARSQSVVLAAVDARRRVLSTLQRGGPYRGHWLLPGGRLEPGERPLDGVRREVAEETGVRTRALRDLAAYDVHVEGQHWHVRMYTGAVHGAPRAEAGSAVR
ncbi:MAG: NUDIX hydrolase, partial [Chloroflexi bacterium]|nr:NUDIX hydrolase [Chloroflexota bacterium]